MIKLILLLFSFFIFPSIMISHTQTPGRQGEWHLLQESIGISAMHMQLLHNNKVVIYDRTDFGRSNLSLPGGQCRFDPHDRVLKVDCTAHSIIYNIAANTFQPLKVQTDTWCSSGALLPNGTLVQTGGYNDGDHVLRTYTPCDDDICDWVEFRQYLSRRRWYATDQILPDGRIIIVGGRGEFSYEFYPNHPPTRYFLLEFLRHTNDENENNLYPFLHLLPDGNLFIFANTRAILFDYNLNQVIREYPEIPGGDARNYPSSGSSVLLPLDENGDINRDVEVVVCGGAPKTAFPLARQGILITSSSTCGRLRVNDQKPLWVMEGMPIPRVMGDMLLLPTGDIIIINGAQRGTAGWELASEPATTPIIYRPYEVQSWRYSVMTPSARPRMYHSTAILLPDGRVLVGGSNPHIYYNFTGVEFPTDLSLEAFSPPYLSTEYSSIRPRILAFKERIKYGETLFVKFSLQNLLAQKAVSVRIVAPSFTTHSFSMNHRMVVLRMVGFSSENSDTYTSKVAGPSTMNIAPPGYYLLFVVHAGIPSYGEWVHIE
ncbi:hypothetical protein K2173_021523 [Erythroxylum novogranatense]|uniref:Galactose oxidase n=1 Tax=Erythroxylum novogranatense TaxID=1862640 RepID=A0AAV8TN45_9ROSI|nr:hypothetical protein K2173_021523 [Erythroxylum novogranatense]